MSTPKCFAKQISLILVSSGLIFVAGCASQPAAQETAAPAAPPPATARPATQAAPAPRPAPAPRAQQVELAPNHPDTYVVQRGDTLWDISSMFLKDPWYWPEVWYVNPQVENPHLIYPGDVLRLVWIDGQQYIIRETVNTVRMSPEVRYEQHDGPILTVPYESISTFLTRPTVFAEEEIDGLPYVLSAKDGHLVTGAGNTIYARGFETSPKIGERYTVMQVGDRLVDPDTDEFLGYEGIYAGEARTSRTGDPTSLFLTATNREVLNGNRLIRDDEQPPLNFYPSPPAQQIDGRIVGLHDAISITGSAQIVIINRGTRHGLQPGNVLEVLRAGEEVTDTYGKGTGAFGDKVTLPDEPAGTMMIFKTFDRISYGLIVRSTSEIREFDLVRNPS